MRSAEFYTAFGHIRQEELLRESAYLRAARRYGPNPGRLSAAASVLRNRLARIFAPAREEPDSAWIERGKPVHG